MAELSLLNTIVYYTCWEDIQIIQRALKIHKNDTVFSITSAGDNILNMLLYNPRRIFSVDFNPYQNYLFELKKEAIRHLNYEKFRDFIGLDPSDNREELYQIIKNSLDEKTRSFWDSNIEILKQGITYSGGKYVKFNGTLIKFFIGSKVIKKLLKCNTIQEQAEYFYAHVYGLPWRLIFYFTYNKTILKLWGCSVLLFEYVKRKKKSPEDFIYLQQIFYPKTHTRKIEKIFTSIPLKNNYIVCLSLLNYYLNENLSPPYLQKKSYPIIQKRIDKIQYKTTHIFEALHSLPDSSITKFNLSNVFDYVDDTTFPKVLHEINRCGKHKARLCYYSTRLDRSIPDDVKGIIAERQLAKHLFEKDRTFHYCNFELATVHKE